jgi:hypothetical protein
MNDENFDRLMKESLAWHAEQTLAQQPPRRLAMRRLATRLASRGRDLRFLPLTRRGEDEISRRRLVANLAVLASVLVVAVLGLAYLLGPRINFGAPGPLHVSERHLYSLRLPDDGWQVTEYPGEWILGTFLDAGGAGSDYFERPPTSQAQDLTYAWIASQPIPPGMTFDGWLYVQDGVTAAAQPCFKLDGEYTEMTVDGERARVGVFHCEHFFEDGDGWATLQVLVPHDGRGYAMYFWPERDSDAVPVAEWRDEALQWLERFHFAEPAATP